MAQYPMDEREFEHLLARIRQETSHASNKLEILYTSSGSFSALQAARILESIAISQHKVMACQMMEPRLCPMTCDESRMILACVNIHNDKVTVLNSLKRVLCDCHTPLGKEYVMSSYPYESDKYRALRILQTVEPDMNAKTAAGGHQGYAPLGGLYTQSRPLEALLYGSITRQQNSSAGHGPIAVPPAADPGIKPAKYASHPSYAYPRDKTYMETKDYPGPNVLLEDEPGYVNRSYPTGAPPFGYHQGNKASFGYPNNEPTPVKLPGGH
uniref:Lophotrochin n=1 Tax=Maculaura alaskensis TaxID=187798 RepID=A0A6M3Z5Q4_9BILA|nr:lophotrochin [Maculaura alaskensis]